jgi:biopolymer transport protein TolR
MAAGAINVASAGGRGRRGRRRPVMSDINVTPFVDVMLVLLIVFMVSAPLLTVGVPVDMPPSQAKALRQNNDPLTISMPDDGKVYLQKDEIALNDLIPKLKAIIDARGGNMSETIYMRVDKKIDYGTMMQVVGRINRAGYSKITFITEGEQGGS